jgi:hypothetical protein
MLKSTLFTNTEVKQAKPKDKEYNLSDGYGLQPRVRPTPPPQPQQKRLGRKYSVSKSPP